MPSEFSPNLNLELQETGENPNTWGDPLNSNSVILERAITEIVEVSTTGGTTVISGDDADKLVIRVTGALAADAIIEVPDRKHLWLVQNFAVNAFLVKVRPGAAGSTIDVQQDQGTLVYTKGDTTVLDVLSLDNAYARYNDDNTFSGDNTFNGPSTFNGTGTFAGLLNVTGTYSYYEQIDAPSGGWKVGRNSAQNIQIGGNIFNYIWSVSSPGNRKGLQISNLDPDASADYHLQFGNNGTLWYNSDGQFDGDFSVGGTLTVTGVSTFNDIMYNESGIMYLDALAGGDADIYFRDDLNVVKAIAFWRRSDNTFYFRHQTTGNDFTWNGSTFAIDNGDISLGNTKNLFWGTNTYLDGQDGGAGYIRMIVNSSQKFHLSSTLFDMSNGLNMRLGVGKYIEWGTSNTARVSATSGTSGRIDFNAGGVSNVVQMYGNTNGFRSERVYNVTTTAAANIYIGANFQLVRTTSSARYKKNIHLIPESKVRSYAEMRGRCFKSDNEFSIDDPDQVFMGFVSEDAFDLDLPEIIDFDDKGTERENVEGLHYGHMLALEREATRLEVSELEARIATLESQVATLIAAP